MVKLFSVKEMIALEKEADGSGLSYNGNDGKCRSGIADEIDKLYSI
jgi:hypothetical protein